LAFTDLGESHPHQSPNKIAPANAGWPSPLHSHAVGPAWLRFALARNGALVSTRRLILYLVLAVAIAVAGFLGITAYSTRQPPVFENSAKLITAMQAFARDHETLGDQCRLLR
jgi:hypothetical protein